jgi:hypothetical protein
VPQIAFKPDWTKHAAIATMVAEKRGGLSTPIHKDKALSDQTASVCVSETPEPPPAPFYVADVQRSELIACRSLKLFATVETLAAARKAPRPKSLCLARAVFDKAGDDIRVDELLHLGQVTVAANAEDRLRIKEALAHAGMPAGKVFEVDLPAD